MDKSLRLEKRPHFSRCEKERIMKRQLTMEEVHGDSSLLCAVLFCILLRRNVQFVKYRSCLFYIAIDGDCFSPQLFKLRHKKFCSADYWFLINEQTIGTE